MWLSTQTQPRHWQILLTWPKWIASRTLTPCCASWPLAAWCRLFIFVRAWTVIFTTTALLHPFIHISHHLLGGKKTHLQILTLCWVSLFFFFKQNNHTWQIRTLIFLSLSFIFLFSSCPPSFSSSFPVQVCRYHSTPSAGSGYRSRHHLPRFDGQT